MNFKGDQLLLIISKYRTLTQNNLFLILRFIDKNIRVIVLIITINRRFARFSTKLF